MDTSTASIYIATSPGQKVFAYANKACNPGTDKEDYLGILRGKCRNPGEEFPYQGAVQSVQFWTPVVCALGDVFVDLPEEVWDAAKDILEAM